jgi:hypothetical protein
MEADGVIDEVDPGIKRRLRLHRMMRCAFRIFLTIGQPALPFVWLAGEKKAEGQSCKLQFRRIFQLLSSALGQTVTETDTTGKKRRTYVIAGGTTIARQGIDAGTTTERVGWTHTDPSGLSSRTTYGSTSGLEAGVAAELDALGNNVGLAPALILQQMRPERS